MKKLLAVSLLFVAGLAFAYEDLAATLTGTASQTYIFGASPKVCIQSTVAVRYKLGTSLSPPTATTTDARIDPGDCYKIPVRNGMDRIAVIHADGVTSFTAYVYKVIE